MLIARRITEADYPLINAWYRDWEFTEVAVKGCVPEYGIIILDPSTGEGIVSCFAYITDSNIVWTEWLVTNQKYNNKALRKEAFKKLFLEIEEHFKAQGYRTLIMTVKNPFLIKTLCNNGFIITDSNMTNLVKLI